MAHPVAAGQIAHHRAVQPTRGAPVYVLHAGRADLEVRVLDQTGKPLAVTPVNLSLHEQAKALLKRELRGGNGCCRVVECGKHAVQAQAAKLFNGLVVNHLDSLDMVTVLKERRARGFSGNSWLRARSRAGATRPGPPAAPLAGSPCRS